MRKAFDFVSKLQLLSKNTEYPFGRSVSFFLGGEDGIFLPPRRNSKSLGVKWLSLDEKYDIINSPKIQNFIERREICGYTKVSQDKNLKQ